MLEPHDTKTPGQAADNLAVLPADEKRTITRLLDPKLVDKIGEIIEEQETNILVVRSH